MRTFIAIDIPENIKDEIVKIQKQIPEFKGKLTEKENLHLTLKFLGETDEQKIKEIKEKLNKIKLGSFEAEIDSLGFFDNAESRNYSQKLIIWLHIKNCEKLQREIDDSLSELFENEKRFMSHLTIARVKNVKNKKEFLEQLKKIKIPKMKLVIEEFKLKKSVLTEKGSVYNDIEIYRIN